MSFSAPTYSPMGVRLPPKIKTSPAIFSKPLPCLQKFSLASETDKIIQRNEARQFGRKLLICEAVLGAVAVKEFFQKTLVRKGRDVICGTEFVQDRHRYSPCHPLARHIHQLPATPEESFNYLDFCFSQRRQ